MNVKEWIAMEAQIFVEMCPVSFVICDAICKLRCNYRLKVKVTGQNVELVIINGQ